MKNPFVSSLLLRIELLSIVFLPVQIENKSDGAGNRRLPGGRERLAARNVPASQDGHIALQGFGDNLCFLVFNPRFNVEIVGKRTQFWLFNCGVGFRVGDRLGGCVDGHGDGISFGSYTWLGSLVDDAFGEIKGANRLDVEGVIWG